MKTISVKVVGSLFLIASAMIAGCNKDDTTAPVITLKGSASMTIYTGDAFADPGATAEDDEDGDLTSKVTVSGSVNTNQAGEYTLKYSVSDQAGNSAEETRTVTVKHKNTTVAGNYSVTESCNFGSVGPYVATVTAGTSNTVDITFGNFGNYTTTINVPATISGTTGQTITLTSGTYAGLTISGSGTINAAGSVMTISYSSTNGSSTDNCTATWTKQ